MKKLFRRAAAAALCVYLLTTAALARELVPVGKVIGLELLDKRVVVAGFDEEQGAAAKAAGILIGDIIQKIDNIPITCAEDVRMALQQSDGAVAVEICREGKTALLQMKPVITKDGPKLGIFLRQGITGIGTVTWYDPETGKFTSPPAAARPTIRPSFPPPGWVQKKAKSTSFPPPLSTTQCSTP